MKHNSAKSKRNPSSAARCPQAKTSFTGPLMTAYGGAGLLRQFVAKLKLADQFERVPTIVRGRKYGIADYLMALLAGLLLGRARQSHIAGLRLDPGALLALGIARMPSQPRLSVFLAGCGDMLANRIWAINRRLVGKMRAGLRSATLDLDGQVVSTRGNPEGADFGYNKKRRGAKSYFMQMAFLGEMRDILFAHHLAGSEATVSSEVAVWLYRKARRAVGHIQRLRLRADAAYYSHEFLTQLETDGVSYFISARASAPLKIKVLQVIYCQLSAKWAIGEFLYQAAGWKRPRRFIVIREKLEPENPMQPTLFHDDDYAYQMIATNADWSPERVWHFYNHRSCLENIIKESQDDFGCDHILSHLYRGNATWLAMSALAYNVTNWFREKILNQRAHRHTARWLREKLIFIPARVVHAAGQWFLKLWCDHPSRGAYEKAQAALEAFCL